jgi:hypothetical protein
MNRISERLIGWAGGAAVLAVVCGATTATATPINPTHCITDSTRTSTGSICYIQLDIVNTPSSSYTYSPTGYIRGSIQTTTDSHTLHMTFDAATVGGVTWSLGDLFLNIVDPAHATASHISFTDATPGSQAPTFSLV